MIFRSFLNGASNESRKEKGVNKISRRRKKERKVEEKSKFHFHERKGKEGFAYYLGRDVGIKVRLND